MVEKCLLISSYDIFSSCPFLSSNMQRNFRLSTMLSSVLCFPARSYPLI